MLFSCHNSVRDTVFPVVLEHWIEFIFTGYLVPEIFESEKLEYN